MKQNLTPEEWGQFEREHPKAADKLKKHYGGWILHFEETNYPNQFVTSEYQSFHLWFTIGRMIEYLDSRGEAIDGVYESGFINRKSPWGAKQHKSVPESWEVSTNNGYHVEEELCDALWEAIKATLEDNNEE